MKTETEMGGMQPQAKGCWQPLTLVLPGSLRRKGGLADTLIWA